MKAFLIIMLLNGEGFAIPFTSMDACLTAEKSLAIDEVEWSRCD